MENKTTQKLILILICLAVVAGIMFWLVFKDNSSTTGLTETGDTTEAIESSSNVTVEYTSSELSGTYTDYKAKINLNNLSVDGDGVSASGTTITISAAGIYYFTGTATDANIVVNADNQEVVLVLDNANITCSSTAVITVVKAKKTTINLAEGSVNTLTDSSNYTAFIEDDEPNGTIFSKDDLSIDGTGKLIVNANYEDGIVSKDGLKIINAEIEINSKDDGIRGKDYTTIKNAKITIIAGGDGIKSTNDTDTTLGYIIIDGGTINIEAKNDGIQAETVLNISEANITITTTAAQSTKSNSMFGNSSSSSSESSKGLKAGTEITINSGNITIHSTDDSIHSNNYIIIKGGNMTLSSGDDGIHADNNILIEDGTINITKSYEGIESNYIKINGGNISVVASDDGINVSGGNDSSSMNRAGQNNFSSMSDSSRAFVINGGTIFVNSDGDGLDSNGSIIITGGTIEVAGSINGGNAPLDYDQTCTVSGGTLIFYGATGMWQNPSTSSTQYTIAFSTTGKSGDKFELNDSNGNTIASFEADKAYGMIGI